MQVHPSAPKRVREALAEALQEPEVEQGQGPSFANLLREGVQSVSDASHEAEKKMKGLITGETESVHEVLSAMGKSDVQFSLMLQVRNKLIDAWQRLSQIRV